MTARRPGGFSSYSDCGFCNGTGRDETDPLGRCVHCDGHGQVEDDERDDDEDEDDDNGAA